MGTNGERENKSYSRVCLISKPEIRLCNRIARGQKRRDYVIDFLFSSCKSKRNKKSREILRDLVGERGENDYFSRKNSVS